MGNCWLQKRGHRKDLSWDFGLVLRPDENFSKTWCQTQTFRKEGINRNKVELLEESNKKVCFFEIFLENMLKIFNGKFSTLL